jgi:Bacteriophage tail sheath protein
MPEYLSPGVYVEEIDTGPKPIAAVATSTAGAVGVALRGPTTPTLITNYGEFVRMYGGPLPIPDEATQGVWDQRGHYWQAAESVKAFFDEGGARLYYQRVVPSGAQSSSVPFHGGLVAALQADVGPADTTITLSHLFGINAGTQLTLVASTGSQIGQVTVQSVDRTTREVTLNAAAGVSAQQHDLAVVTAVNNALDVLTATAASAGAWGDDLSVQILPMVGARRTLAATAASGAKVSTQTTANANAGDTDITVTPVAGSLDAQTATPFQVRINGGAPVTVNAVADAAPNVTLTLAAALSAALPAGSQVTMIRPAVSGSEITVTGADRLYPEAVVQLEGAAGGEIRVVQSVVGSQVTLTQAPGNTYVEGDTVSLVEAEVRVRYRPAGGTEETEHFAGLRLTNQPDPASLIAGLNLRSHWIRLRAGNDYDATTLANFPAVTTGGWGALGGGDDALGTLTTADFIGVNPGPGQRTGIQALEEIDEVAICLVPCMWDGDVQRELIVHCETMAERFAILDPPPDLSVQEVQAFRSPIDTTFAALYYPWVQIRDPRPGAGGAEDIAPSGFVAGVYARTDIARGVHKAPANEVLRSIRGFTQTITKREQDVLNPQNINVLRFFPGRGNRVWGARVLTSNTSWRYVSVRRLFLMIEESIDEGTQWVVFEPNDEPLWARVRQSVTRFLTTEWRLGALQGATADEAFFVACDRSTMTQDDIDNGRLICEIGIAPVRPAEFVIFRISQRTREDQTT